MERSHSLFLGSPQLSDKQDRQELRHSPLLLPPNKDVRGPEKFRALTKVKSQEWTLDSCASTSPCPPSWPLWTFTDHHPPIPMPSDLLQTRRETTKNHKDAQGPLLPGSPQPLESKQPDPAGEPGQLYDKANRERRAGRRAVVGLLLKAERGRADKGGTSPNRV